jgi:chromosome segregation ATPase
MSTEKLSTELQSLERKINLLLTEHKSLKASLTDLKGQNSALQAQLRTKNEQLSGFQNQIKISKIAGSVGADRGDASELKKKIDEYVDEIDRCIAHLSQ